MATKANTRIFHGGKFHERNIKTSKQSAEAEKGRLQKLGKQVRITEKGGKHIVWVK